MKINIVRTKCKRSSEIEPNEERKSLKILKPATATEGLEMMKSTAEEKSCSKQCVTVTKYNRKQTDMEKVTGPENNGPSRSETGPANQIDDKSPSKQFARIDKSSCADVKREGQESCLPPASIAAYDSRGELLPGKIVQDRQVLNEEMMDTLKHGAARDEKSSEKNKKKMKISTKVARDEKSPEKNKKMKISTKTLKARKAELKQLKKETTMFSRELQRCSTMCMQLVDDNNLLMDELKKMCDPRVIEILEAKNPAGKDP